MSEKSDEKLVMYQTVDWKAEIGAIAGPLMSSDTQESWLARAARKSHSKFWHIKALFYGQLTDPKYSVAYKILSAADQARIQEAKRDATKLATIFGAAASQLSNIDEDFHRQSIAALEHASRVFSSKDSSGT